MLRINQADFIQNAEKLIHGAVVNDNFLTIETEHGNAVLITEAEWEMCCHALQMILTADIHTVIMTDKKGADLLAEKDEKKRNAAIDSMTGADAKDFAKRLLRVMYRGD